MPDPIWLDTNVARRAIEGDIIVRGEIAATRKAGRKVLIVPAVRHELLDGNPLKKNSKAPTPASRVAQENELRRLGIEVDMSAEKLPRSKRVGDTMMDHLPRKKNQEVPSHFDSISESDRVILGQIKTSAEARGVEKPQMLTAEGPTKAMNTHAHLFGVEAIRSKPPAPTSGGGGGGSAKPTTVSLSDYPPDNDGPISKVFRDRPVLEKLGLIGGSVAASLLSGKALELIQKHFESVLGEARKEFHAKYPEAASLARNARIDEHRKAYEAAVAKLRAPSAAKAIGAVLVAIASDKDREAVLRHVQTQLSKVKLADGSAGGFADAASAYINAMADLMTALAKYQIGLPDIANDVGQRAAVLQDAGDGLMKTFWEVVPHAAVSPVTYYPWLDVYHVAQVFQNLGSRVGGFAAEIKGRASAYERMAASLDKELIKVSEQLGKYAP